MSLAYVGTQLPSLTSDVGRVMACKSLTSTRPIYRGVPQTLTGLTGLVIAVGGERGKTATMSGAGAPDFFYREAQRLGYVARSAFKVSPPRTPPG